MKRKRKRSAVKLLLAVICMGALLFMGEDLTEGLLGRIRVYRLKTVQSPDWVDIQLIRVDGDSRRGVPLEGLNDIVIHYVGNPGTTAQQNRDYYENPQSEVSSHFVVGLEGEIIQCLPLWEKSSASNHRNRDTISIEVCHPDGTGRFTDASYDALVELTAWLLEITGLDAEHVIRHYDVTGKQCPKYFVINEDSWAAFKQDVARALK